VNDVTQKIFYNLFVAVIIIAAVLLLATMLPIPGNYEVKIVKSGSMEPAIHTGSVVVVKPEASYKQGDVITFGKDTKTQVPTTHRIVDTQVKSGIMHYITKGDANNAPD
jgi:signal peptidase I